MKQGHRIVDSLVRIREVVLTTQQAQIPEQPQDPRYKAANGFEPEESSQYGEDTKGGGGFAGADSKKRRGVSLSETGIISLLSALTCLAARCAPRAMSQL